ncbi:MAG TPA: ABC transporter permease [Candidatus Saccharimonadia bacterium]|nr:ABC transporter permease [Candidatus Saccharimonadia bacterium]
MGTTKMFLNSIEDTFIITTRNLKRYVRLPQLLFFSSIQPVMFLLLFNYVFGGALGKAITVPGGKYINYLLPGILIQVVMFGGVQTGIGLADDMGRGMVDRFRSLPMSRLAVVAGRTLSDSIRNLSVTIIMVSVGLLLGFRFQIGLINGLYMAIAAILFGFALSWVFAFIGMSVKDSETAQISSFLMIFPLTFASAAFVPIATMPRVLQAFARNQPVTFAVEVTRHFAIGTPANGAVWKLLFWTIGILIVFVPLSIRQYKKRSV